MAKKKLLRPFTGTGCVFFPIGLPPKGTCEFSTKKCRKHCYIDSASLFDWESNITNEDRVGIYDYIINTTSTVEICNRMIEDLDGLQTSILHWFGSGDCETKHTNKISEIINQIPSDVTQMGFTRNAELWKRHKDIFAFTTEQIDDTEGQSGLFSIPNYEEQVSVIHSFDRNIKGGVCGPVTCRDIVDTALEHHINCQVCCKYKMGCFDK